MADESSKSNAYFRELLNKDTSEADKPAAKRKPLPLPAAQLDAMGSWEKHTKGFGAKMLSKFGFTGRLGANEDGVSRSIEVSVRPSQVGLGYGHVTEAAALPANKQLEAEWRGIDVSIEIDSESWRKGASENLRRTKKKLSVVELLQAQEETADKAQRKRERREEQQRQKDEQQGPGSRFAKEPELGQELLHNVSMLLEVEGGEAMALSRKLHLLVVRAGAFKDEVATLTGNIDADAAKLDRLERLGLTISRVRSKLEAGAEGVTAQALCDVFESMFKSFPEEFSVFGVINLVHAFAGRLIELQLQSWNAMEDPLLLVEVAAGWIPLEDFFKNEDKPHFAKLVREMVGQVVEQRALPLVRRELVSRWVLLETDRACVALLTALRGAVGARPLADLLDNSVLPKIQLFVSSWLPREQSSLHECFRAWAPLLGDRLGVLFPEVRQRISQTLASWNGVDSVAVDIVKPWQDLFDKNSFNNLVFRVVVPKVVGALRSMEVNPSNQDISVVRALLLWIGVIPAANLSALLVGELFPKWLDVLYHWLSANPDLDEVTEWYLGWKSLFPEAVSEEATVQAQFHLALDMMDASISGRAIVHPYNGVTGPSANSYVAIMEAVNLEQQMQSRLLEMKRDGIRKAAAVVVSFKEVVEAFAESKSIEFRPRDGKTHDDKPVWSFGRSSIYLDQNVAFVYSNASKLWSPIGLEELALIS